MRDKTERLVRLVRYLGEATRRSRRSPGARAGSGAAGQGRPGVGHGARVRRPRRGHGREVRAHGRPSPRSGPGAARAVPARRGRRRGAARRSRAPCWRPPRRWTTSWPPSPAASRRRAPRTPTACAGPRPAWWPSPPSTACATTCEKLVEQGLRRPGEVPRAGRAREQVVPEATAFILERLAKALTDDGIGRDIVDAVLPTSRDFLDLRARAEALQRFRAGPAWEDLVTVYTRPANLAKKLPAGAAAGGRRGAGRRAAVALPERGRARPDGRVVAGGRRGRHRGGEARLRQGARPCWPGCARSWTRTSTTCW